LRIRMASWSCCDPSGWGVSSLADIVVRYLSFSARLAPLPLPKLRPRGSGVAADDGPHQRPTTTHQLQYKTCSGVTSIFREWRRYLSQQCVAQTWGRQCVLSLSL
jgi:hypothetical protein